jgi:ketosteroid isomerase-like protein
MRRLFSRAVITTLILLTIAPIVLAQSQSGSPQPNTPPQPKPCAARPEYRQFDFWIGEWDVQAGGQQAGTSSVQLILDQCVIFENWTGVRGGMGKSFNIYNAAAGKWQQTWVDSMGNVSELYGEFKDGAMRLVGEKPDPKGGKIITKLSFIPLEGGRVRQLWESSQDGGKTWYAMFDGLYTRRRSAASATDLSTSGSGDEELVKAAMRRYSQYVKDMNSEGIAALFTSDGELIDAGKLIAQSPASIRKFLGSFEGAVRVEENINTIDSVTVTGATAVLVGTYRQKVLMLADNRPVQVQGKFEVEWSRQPDGQWLIHRMRTQGAQ